MWSTNKKYLQIIIILISSLFLCSCNDSNSPSTLRGVVMDDPLVGATVTAYGTNFETLGTAITDSDGEYNISIPYDSAYRIVASGGTIDGVPFTGTMKSICNKEQMCNATPLTTLTATLVDNYKLSFLQAQEEVSRTMMIDLGEDPFILEYQGKASEANQNTLSYIRENTNNGIDIDTWISTMLEDIPKPYNGTIKGTVKSDISLDNSDIKIINTDGNTFETVTNSEGEGKWETSKNIVINNTFRVEAQNILDFNGTLSTYVPYSNDMNLTNSTIELTILSTLVDRYIKHSMKTYNDATKAVKTYLSIPDDISLNDDMIDAYFSSDLFISQSEENGGFDAFVDAMILKIDSGESIFIGGVNNHAFLDLTLGQLTFRGLLGGAGGAAVGFVLNKALLHLGPKIGYYSPEQITAQKLEEIQNTLNEMKVELTAVDTRLTSLLKQSTFEIISHIYTSQANIAAGNINTWFSEYTTVKTTDDNGIINNDITKYNLQKFFNEKSTSDIKDAMTTIDSTLFTSYFGTESGLEFFVKKLEEQLRTTPFGNEKNEELYKAYKGLETYFLQALGTQIKALVLLRAKLSFENDEQLADNYENNIIAPRIKEQLKNFMIFTERLVAASANTETLVTGTSQMFPSCTKDIFHDADLIAQLSDEHDVGFVMRVAGDPKSIAEYLVSPQGFGWGEVTSISINDKDIREYNAPLTDGVSYYLGWNIDKNKRWHFSKETKIAFAKLTFKKLTGSRLSPKHRIYTFPYSQKADVDFEQIEPDNNPYANCFVTARALPKFNFKNENKVHATSGYQTIFEHKADMNNAKTEARVTLSKSSVREVIFAVDTQADMYLEVINDSSSSVDLQLSGTVNLDVDSKVATDMWMNIHIDNNIIIPPYLELHWQVKVGSENIFSREWKYNINRKNNRSSNHNIEYTDDGKTATWEGGGTLNEMRQIYFRVSRAKTDIATDWSFSRYNFDFDTIFKTTLNRLELKPVE